MLKPSMILLSLVFATSAHAQSKCRILKVNGTDKSLSSSERTACMQNPLIFGDQPTLTPAQLKAGPTGPQAIAGNDQIYCNIAPRKKQENSLKFRCFRTNYEGQYYDNEGRLVPSAIGFKWENQGDGEDDGKLFSGSGQVILKPDGEAVKGDELRVKYYDGNPRMREGFTELVATRLFWALGLQSDTVYMPASVACRGCSDDPFNKNEFRGHPGQHVFVNAAIKRKYDGKKIDDSFEFEELGAACARGGNPDTCLEYQAYLIALNMVAYNNSISLQNKFVCKKGDRNLNKATGECYSPVPYVSDIGASFGAKTSAFLGLGKNPRGDYLKYIKKGVFGNTRTCELTYDLGGVINVSEDARAFLADRLSNLTTDHIRKVFEAARIDAMDPNANLNQWVAAVDAKRQEIMGARCR